MKQGEVVTVSNKLVRVGIYEDDRWDVVYPVFKSWEKAEIEPIKCLVLGWTYLKDGRFVDVGEEYASDIVFQESRTFKAYSVMEVTPNGRYRKPFHTIA